MGKLKKWLMGIGLGTLMTVGAYAASVTGLEKRVEGSEIVISGNANVADYVGAYDMINHSTIKKTPGSVNGPFELRVPNDIDQTNVKIIGYDTRDEKTRAKPISDIPLVAGPTPGATAVATPGVTPGTTVVATPTPGATAVATPGATPVATAEPERRVIETYKADSTSNNFSQGKNAFKTLMYFLNTNYKPAEHEAGANSIEVLSKDDKVSEDDLFVIKRDNEILKTIKNPYVAKFLKLPQEIKERINIQDDLSIFIFPGGASDVTLDEIIGSVFGDSEKLTIGEYGRGYVKIGEEKIITKSGKKWTDKDGNEIKLEGKTTALGLNYKSPKISLPAAGYLVEQVHLSNANLVNALRSIDPKFKDLTPGDLATMFELASIGGTVYQVPFFVPKDNAVKAKIEKGEPISREDKRTYKAHLTKDQKLDLCWALLENQYDPSTYGSFKVSDGLLKSIGIEEKVDGNRILISSNNKTLNPGDSLTYLSNDKQETMSLTKDNIKTLLGSDEEANVLSVDDETTYRPGR